MKHLVLSILFLAGLLMSWQISFAHCDTKDGPVVAAGTAAIEKNNINYALIWIQPSSEQELRDLFDLTMRVRGLSDDAKLLADNYFFETLVRLHRAGEGISYTGIQPLGTPISPKIKAADKSIEIGNLSPLEGVVPRNQLPELQILFDKLMAFKNYDVNDVEAGRKYIEAYVQFFHLAEGEEANHQAYMEAASPLKYLPWILLGIVFIVVVLFGRLDRRIKFILNKNT